MYFSGGDHHYRACHQPLLNSVWGLELELELSVWGLELELELSVWKLEIEIELELELELDRRFFTFLHLHLHFNFTVLEERLQPQCFFFLDDIKIPPNRYKLRKKV